MKELHRKDLANHPGPEPCEGGRKVALEALDRGEQPTRLRILRGESPRAVNCLYSDGKHIRCMRR
jgi:hypothetical protein